MDLDPQFIDVEDLYLEDCLDTPIFKDGDSWLPSEDYNLNSPLLRDRVDGFISKLNSKTTCPERHSFGQHISMSNLQGSTNYHQFAVRQFLQSQVAPSQETRSILNDVEQGIKGASEVHKAYWIHFGKTPCPDQLDPKWLSDYYQTDIRFRKDFEGFWFWHRVVVVMNLTSSDPSYISQGSLFPGLKVCLADGVATVVLEHLTYGTVVIRDGLCVMDRQRQVLDRNMVLAIKDTLMGRCAVKLVTTKRTDSHIEDSRIRVETVVSTRR